MANEVLDFADDFGRQISNLALQKILYFIQGRHILHRDAPIIDGFFEAWPYGPVMPIIYDTFKVFGAKPITDRARLFDYVLGSEVVLDTIQDKELKLFVRDSAKTYSSLSAGQLIELSHARGGPWDIVTRNGSGRRYGSRISNAVIGENFRKHFAAISNSPTLGEPDEEAPPPRN